MKPSKDYYESEKAKDRLGEYSQETCNGQGFENKTYKEPLSKDMTIQFKNWFKKKEKETRINNKYNERWSEKCRLKPQWDKTERGKGGKEGGEGGERETDLRWIRPSVADNVQALFL